MRFVGTAVGPGPRDLGVEARPEHQRSGGNKPLQKSAPADVLDSAHAHCHALASAAALIAARMRW